MMPATKWYEHQQIYRKHGIDMRPKNREMKKNKNNEMKISSKDKGILLFMLMAFGILFVSIIIIVATSTNIKYDINQVGKENLSIATEIESLELQLNKANNIEYIEGKAMNELGMVKPEKIVYLEKDEKPARDFALLLKEEAYN